MIGTLRFTHRVSDPTTHRVVHVHCVPGLGLACALLWPVLQVRKGKVERSWLGVCGTRWGGRNASIP